MVDFNYFDERNMPVKNGRFLMFTFQSRSVEMIARKIKETTYLLLHTLIHKHYSRRVSLLEE